jgi:hypothetical protein
LLFLWHRVDLRLESRLFILKLFYFLRLEVMNMVHEGGLIRGSGRTSGFSGIGEVLVRGQGGLVNGVNKGFSCLGGVVASLSHLFLEFSLLSCLSHSFNCVHL